MRNERSLSKYADHQRFKRMRAEGNKKPEVYIRIGPTRSGKTSYVYKKHGYDQVYSVFDVTGKWHDGYAGEPVLLYDDVDSSRAPAIEYFKKITDGNPERYPNKGGAVSIRPTHIYVTSNHQPSEWWPGISPSDWNAIKSRITEVRLVFKDKDDVVVYSKDASGIQENVQRSYAGSQEGQGVDNDVQLQGRSVLQEEEECDQMEDS